MNLLEKNIKINNIRYKNSNTTMQDESNYPLSVLNSTPLSRYTQRFNKFIPKIEDLNEKHKECLNEFALSLEHINAALEPFKEQGIDYTIGLAGGAVRVFLLDRIEDIKDHDIYLRPLGRRGSK